MAGEVVFKDKKLKKFLGDMEKQTKLVADKSKKYAQVIQSIAIGDVARHFEDERGPKGKWKRWSFAYSLFQQSRGKGGNKVLSDTGRLRGGFRAGNFRKIKDGILFFNKTPYARKHDEGLEGLPQRQFMWLSDRALETMGQATLDFILRHR